MAMLEIFAGVTLGGDLRPPEIPKIGQKVICLHAQSPLTERVHAKHNLASLDRTKAAMPTESRVCAGCDPRSRPTLPTSARMIGIHVKRALALRMLG